MAYDIVQEGGFRSKNGWIEWSGGPVWASSPSPSSSIIRPCRFLLAKWSNLVVDGIQESTYDIVSIEEFIVRIQATWKRKQPRIVLV